MRMPIAFLIGLACAGSLAHADEVTLRGGATYSGAILRDSMSSVTIQSDGIAWTFPRARVAAVKRDATTREKELARTAAERVNDDGPVIAPSAVSKRIVLYGTSWCGWCQRARSYLNSRGVAFEDRDVEQDEEAAAELKALRRKAGIRNGGVPVIDVGGTVISGFDRPRLDAALEALDQR